MSFRSKRTFVDVQQNVEQSSTLESDIDQTNSTKKAKISFQVSNRWGPFTPSTLRPTNASSQNLKMIASDMTKILRAIRDGKASLEMLDGAEATLNMVINQNIDAEDDPVDERLIDI